MSGHSQYVPQEPAPAYLPKGSASAKVHPYTSYTPSTVEYNTNPTVAQAAPQTPPETVEQKDTAIDVKPSGEDNNDDDTKKKPCFKVTQTTVLFCVAASAAAVIALALLLLYNSEKAADYQPIKAFGSNIDLTTKRCGRKDKRTCYTIWADITFQFLEKEHTVPRYKETFHSESKMDKFRTDLRSVNGADGWVSAHDMTNITFDYWEPEVYFYFGIAFVVVFVGILFCGFMFPCCFDKKNPCSLWNLSYFLWNK